MRKDIIMNNRNLIRFDWAIKRLLRNKADFMVLEGFLSELLKEKIIIEDILESEGNQQTEDDKFNRVDILVKNSKNELVLVEIQNQNEFDYFQRMTYGTSKVIVEYLSLGDRYNNLKKVYSINIVYFDLGQGKDYVYHGKTDFYGVHHSDKLLLSSKQSEILGKMEPSEILPEYYVIKVNQFDDIAKDNLDQWIYYLKNNEIKDEFNAQGIDEVRKLWRIDKLTEEEQNRYKKHIDNLHYQASMEWTLKLEAEDRVEKRGIKKGIEEGIKKGIEQGKKNKAIESAKVCLKEGYPLELISKITGLTVKEISDLKG